MIIYADAYDLLDNALFKKRVIYARLRTAAFILVENPTIPDHANRLDWAQKVLSDTVQMPIRNMLLYIITDPAVAQDGALVTDVALQAVVDNAVPKLIVGG